VNKILPRSQTVLSSIIDSDKDMAHYLNEFFCQKKLSIYDGFPSSTLSQGMLLVEASYLTMVDTLEPFTESDMKQLLTKSSIAFYASKPFHLTKYVINNNLITTFGT